MKDGHYDLNFEHVRGCIDIHTELMVKCDNILPMFLSMPILSKEAAIRLAHKGVFPIEASTAVSGIDMGTHYIYLKDRSGSIVGTSEEITELLVPIKPNNKLTKLERKQLKELGLL